MKKSLIILLALAAAGVASAQGFPVPAFTDPGETCYSWNGGHKSAGSFSRCSPAVIVAIAPPAPPPPAPVLMQTPVCPPTVILEPEPKKPSAKPRPRPRPAPKC